MRDQIPNNLGRRCYQTGDTMTWRLQSRGYNAYILLLWPLFILMFNLHIPQRECYISVDPGHWRQFAGVIRKTEKGERVCPAFGINVE